MFGRALLRPAAPPSLCPRLPSGLLPKIPAQNPQGFAQACKTYSISLFFVKRFLKKKTKKYRFFRPVNFAVLGC
jgi:hypothetical protein